jgi:hypothetical protein
MQGGIERAVLHLEKIVCRPLNMLTDLVPVSGTIKKRPQNKHVKSALEKACALLRLLCHRRRSTLNVEAMVDRRLSLVKRWRGLRIHK